MKRILLVVLCLTPLLVYTQKWSRYLYKAPGLTGVTPPKNDFYNSSVGGVKLNTSVGFLLDYRPERQITFGTGIELSYVSASAWADAFDGVFGNSPPYTLQSNFTSAYVNLPLFARLKTQKRDRKFGYLLLGGGASISPFGFRHNYLAHRTSNRLDDLSRRLEPVDKGFYHLKGSGGLPVSAYLSVGVGANFTLNERPFFVELMYMGDVTDWTYTFHNPYFSRSESETFVRKAFQLKLGINLSK